VYFLRPSLVFTVTPVPGCVDVCYGHLSGAGLKPFAEIDVQALSGGVDFFPPTVVHADALGSYDGGPFFDCDAVDQGFATSTTAANLPITSNTIDSPGCP
jgi:hypothetical protein